MQWHSGICFHIHATRKFITIAACSQNIQALSERNKTVKHHIITIARSPGRGFHWVARQTTRRRSIISHKQKSAINSDYASSFAVCVFAFAGFFSRIDVGLRTRLNFCRCFSLVVERSVIANWKTFAKTQQTIVKPMKCLYC